MIEGNDVRRVSLTAGTIEEIQFEDVYNVSLNVLTDGVKVAYKVNDTMVDIDDTTANIVDTNVLVAVNIYRGFEINQLFVVSDVNCDIQWEIRR